jgi:hypothetical protein
LLKGAPMTRNFFAALCVSGGLVIPALVPGSAPACGHVPDEIHLKRMLSQPKATDADRRKVMQLLDEIARKGEAARISLEFKQAFREMADILNYKLHLARC